MKHSLYFLDDLDCPNLCMIDSHFLIEHIDEMIDWFHLQGVPVTKHTFLHNVVYIPASLKEGFCLTFLTPMS